MSVRKFIIGQVAVALTSPRLRTIRRGWFEFKRILTRSPRTIHVFLRAADPYSYLVACSLPDFVREHRLRIRLHTVLDLPAEMMPRPDLLEAYSRLDAARVGRQNGCKFSGESRPPATDLIRAATALLLQCETEPEPSGMDRAARTLHALWNNDREFFANLPRTDSELTAEHRNALKKNEELLSRLGHYNSAMIYYGGEWYWGIDRLWHLSKRLSRAAKTNNAPPASTAGAAGLTTAQPSERNTETRIDLYYSFRSPYSYLVLSRAFAFIDRHGLKLNVKPVLPMVMRGLAVPRAKRFYILKDAGREAERNEIPFGRVADPLGVGVERCMAGFACARKHSREREFLLAASQMIWSEGVDVATDRGLAAVVERAGLDWVEFQSYLKNEDWRQMAEKNQEDLFSIGLWGVPSLHLKDTDTIVWGQDRFEILEDAVQRRQ